MVPGISGLSVSDFPGSIGICHADGYHHRGACQRGSPLDDLYGITVPSMYSFQVNDYFKVVPHFQFIANPAYSTSSENILWGVQAVFSF